ncbi:MAG: hypothetical protein Q7S59_10350 [Sulfurimonas sp.]|nr:hypothetical protein [Sulfurimonas sp.]
MSLKIIKELKNAVVELDHNKASWIDKWMVIDLKHKAQILLESITRLEEGEKESALEAAQEFLTVVRPVILELNNQQVGAL